MKVWLEDGNATTWSEPTRFSVGLLKGSDWKGRWIKHPEASTPKHIWFRKKFALTESATKAFVYVASLGYHELYINGKKADDRVLAPAVSRLDKRVLYVTYDITDKLHTGDNVIAIWHGPGWAGFSSFKTSPALLVQADILTENGEMLSVVSDATWKCSESSSEPYFHGFGGELIDARRLNPDWNKVPFDDNNWDNAASVERNVQLSAQIAEPDRIIETIMPARITELGKDACKVDFGKNFTGWFEIKNLRGNPGSTITICIANDPDTPQSFAQRNAFICRDHPGTFCNRLNYQAGRYVTVSGLSYKPELADFQSYALSTVLERTGHFKCSSELLNKIYETDLWTFRATTLNGVTVDCPHRERLGYGEVTFATAWGCGLPNYNAGFLLAARSQLVRCPARERLASARRTADSFFALGRHAVEFCPADSRLGNIPHVRR